MRRTDDMQTRDLRRVARRDRRTRSPICTTQVEAIVQRIGGPIEKTDNGWGRRKLAYEIGQHKEGIYVLEVIKGSGELMKEIDRRFKVTDRSCCGTSIVRVDEEQTVVGSRRAPSGPRRRAAAALPAACRPIGSRVKVRRATIDDDSGDSMAPTWRR